MTAVVAQDVAPRRIRILEGRQPPTDEKIRAAIAVEIADANRCRAGEHCGQSTDVAHELPTALVDVETVLKR